MGLGDCTLQGSKFRIESYSPAVGTIHDLISTKTLKAVFAGMTLTAIGIEIDE
jgi:hypothetical protein